MTPEHLQFDLFVVAPAVLAAATALVFHTYRIHRRPTTIRLLIGNVLVFLSLCSLLVDAGEVYFRFFCDTTDSFGMGMVHRRWFARHVRYNNVGRRDSVDYSPTPESGRRRITFLGDSFTFGHGVDDVERRFANLVRDTLSDVEVHCVANTGWDTDLHVKVATKLSESDYAMDLVALVYVLNDISDLLPEGQDAGARLRTRYKPGLLCANSYLFDSLYLQCFVAHDPLFRNYDRGVLEAYEGELWYTQRQRLSELREIVESRGGELLVVTFPYLHETSRDEAHRRVYRQLADFWLAEGVAHLDLSDAMSRHESAELVVNKRDAHPNEVAHRIAAREIAQFLSECMSSPPRRQGQDLHAQRSLP